MQLKEASLRLLLSRRIKCIIMAVLLSLKQIRFLLLTLMIINSLSVVDILIVVDSLSVVDILLLSMLLVLSTSLLFTLSRYSSNSLTASADLAL
jgi:hypothetical protein